MISWKLAKNRYGKLDGCKANGEGSDEYVKKSSEDSLQTASNAAFEFQNMNICLLKFGSLYLPQWPWKGAVKVYTGKKKGSRQGGDQDPSTGLASCAPADMTHSAAQAPDWGLAGPLWQRLGSHLHLDAGFP